MDLMLGPVRDLGDFIRQQRQAAQLSLRGLAAKAGISNPYLSQVERGLRRPSADTLAQIAKGLSISAESLLVRAGVLPARPDGAEGTGSTDGDAGAARATNPGGAPAGPDGTGGDVVAAIRRDRTLSDRQKAALLEIYTAFAAEHTADQHPADEHAADRHTPPHAVETPIPQGD